MPTPLKNINEISPLDKVGPDTIDPRQALDLTGKHTAFVDAFFIHGGNATAAAKAAGYNNPNSYGLQLVKMPKIASAIRRQYRRTFETRGLSLSWKVLERILTDDKASDAIQAKVALKIVDLVYGKDGNRQDETQVEDKPISEMTVEELEKLVKQGRETLERERNAVDITPNNGADQTVLTGAPLSTKDSEGDTTSGESP